jgi:hypothetical protein
MLAFHPGNGYVEKAMQPFIQNSLQSLTLNKLRYEIHFRFSPLQYLAFISVQNLPFPVLRVFADHFMNTWDRA